MGDSSILDVIGLAGMTGTEIGILVVDFLVLFIFFYMLVNNMQTMRMKGSIKALTWLFVIWSVARVVGMDMTVSVFSTMMGYVLLLVVIVFPTEFKKMLDRYGRKKSIFWSTDKLIGPEERQSVAEAMIDLSRKRTGFLLVIAKESGLEDEIDNGDILGEVNISKDMLLSLWDEDSNFNRGAMVVRDNVIVSANSMLPVAKKDSLIRAGAGDRHLAALGITYAEDCVALVVSSTTGKITVASKQGKGLNYHFALDTREHDIRNGLDVEALQVKIEEALTGKEVKEGSSGGKKLTREEREKQMNERKEKQQLEREKKRQETEERRRLRREGKEVPKKSRRKRNKKEQTEGPKSRGFGGYER